MILFQSLKKLYQTIGVYSPLSNQIYSINSNFLFFSLSIASNFCSMFAYFLFKAKSVEDYGNSFYGSTAALSSLADVVINFRQIPTALQMFKNCEQFIEKSKKKIFGNFEF